MSQKIEVGQRWASRDRRDMGRTVTVESVDEIPSGYVVVRSFRRSRMRKYTLRGRYTLVATPHTPTPTNPDTNEAAAAAEEVGT